MNYKIKIPSTLGLSIDVITDEGGGSITSNLHENEDEALDAADLESMKKWNAYIDAIESIVLAHACAGIDVTSKKYRDGIDTAYQAFGDNND